MTGIDRRDNTQEHEAENSLESSLSDKEKAGLSAEEISIMEKEIEEKLRSQDADVPAFEVSREELYGVIGPLYREVLYEAGLDSVVLKVSDQDKFIREIEGRTSTERDEDTGRYGYIEGSRSEWHAEVGADGKVVLGSNISQEGGRCLLKETMVGQGIVDYTKPMASRPQTRTKETSILLELGVSQKKINELSALADDLAKKRSSALKEKQEKYEKDLYDKLQDLSLSKVFKCLSPETQKRLLTLIEDIEVNSINMDKPYVSNDYGDSHPSADNTWRLVQDKYQNEFLKEQLPGELAKAKVLLEHQRQGEILVNLKIPHDSSKNHNDWVIGSSGEFRDPEVVASNSSDSAAAWDAGGQLWRIVGNSEIAIGAVSDSGQPASQGEPTINRKIHKLAGDTLSSEQIAKVREIEREQNLPVGFFEIGLDENQKKEFQAKKSEIAAAYGTFPRDLARNNLWQDNWRFQDLALADGVKLAVVDPYEEESAGSNYADVLSGRINQAGDQNQVECEGKTAYILERNKCAGGVLEIVGYKSYGAYQLNLRWRELREDEHKKEKEPVVVDSKLAESSAPDVPAKPADLAGLDLSQFFGGGANISGKKKKKK